jgi:DNA-binding transcriptional MerR regulator
VIVSNEPISSPLHKAREILAELYVDTDYDALDVASIAERLHATGLSLAEIERIYYDEVAPVCSWSLGAVGPWPGINPQWLHSEIERRADSWTRKLPESLQNIRRRWKTSMTKRDWEIVRMYLSQPERLKAELARLRAPFEELASK